MNLNRRSMFGRLAAIPLAIAGVAVAQKASAQTLSSSSINDIDPIMGVPSAAPQLPPPDTRSPREVWQDQELRYNEWLDGIINSNPRYRTFIRQINQVSGRTYLKLKDRLLARGIKPEELVMGGDTFLVIHGNLYTIGQWW